jgi:hypothetical protein
MAEKKRWRSTGKTAIKKKRHSKVKEDDRKIRDGERRKGPNGKMNIYDAKTKRWIRANKSDKLSDGSKEKNYGKRSNTSGTVSSAKSVTKRLPRNVGLGGENSGKRVFPKDRTYQYTPGRDQVKKVRGRAQGPKKLQFKGIGSRVNKGTTGSRREKMQKRR